MSFLSDVKSAARKAYDRAEHAAGAVTEKAKEAVAAGSEKVKEATGRAKPAEPPPPSKAVDDHTAQAAAAAARNAPKVTANANGAAKPPQAANPNLGVFAGFGMGAAGGAGPDAAGIEGSAGYVVGLGNGDIKSYGSYGSAKEAAGVSAGVGFEAGVVVDSKAMYGDGHHYVATASIFSVNVQTTPEGKFNALSVGVAKSTGIGAFHFETKTEDTTGR